LLVDRALDGFSISMLLEGCKELLLARFCNSFKTAEDKADIIVRGFSVRFDGSSEFNRLVMEGHPMKEFKVISLASRLIGWPTG
jgi:hypothetical protein